jgi:uncharacterized protein with PIN domain
MTMAIDKDKVSFRFYEELNDFLPLRRRKQEFSIPFRAHNSIKDMIESVGVPHTEIDLILVNGESVDFAYIVRPGDRISVYPEFELLDISPLTRLRPEPLRRTRFVLDTHLGKLARYLRLFGFDTWYDNSTPDEKLAEIAAAGDKRILLTRDYGVLKRKQVTHGYFVRHDQPFLQVKEVLARFDLYSAVQAFSRCTQCNGLIQPIDKERVKDHLPRKVAERHDQFSACDTCHRVYWKGSHYDHMQRIIDSLLQPRES